MANVPGAYCGIEDLRTGDLSAPSYSTPEQYVTNAAEEIDAAIGHIYVTPIQISQDAKTRPSVLFLKKINWLLASGRFILDVAAAGESDGLHAYGKRMLDEAAAMLNLLVTGELKLEGANPINPPDDGEINITGPFVLNEDSESLVKQFYQAHDRNLGVLPSAPIGFYDAGQRHG